MLRLIPRIEECKKCPWWYNDDDIIGCTIPCYHRFDTLPECTCTMTTPSMNVIPNEDKMNIPMVTPLNLIGDEMKCKDCRFVIIEGVTCFCIVNERIEAKVKEVNPETTACWEFKLKTVDMPYHDKTLGKDQTRDNFASKMNETGPVIDETEAKLAESMNEIQRISEGVHLDKNHLQTVQAVIGDAVEVRFKGLHRVEYMIKLPNGFGAAVLTGPDGISRLLTQNECYFVKRISKEEGKG